MLRSPVSGGWLLALAAPFAGQQGVRVNGPLARGEGYEAGDVLAFRLSPDGMWAAFFADPDGDDLMELFGVPAGGGEAPRRLNGPLVAGGHLVEVTHEYGEVFSEPWLAIGSGNRVVYWGDQDTDEVIELFSVPIDGSAPPVKLSGALGWWATTPEVLCKLTPDGARVVFVADPEGDGVFELYSVPIDGSSPAVVLNGTLVPGASFLPYHPQDAVISPDGQTVVYRLDALGDEVYELFAVPITGESAPVRISVPMVVGGDVRSIGEIGPMGDRVVFVADAEQDGTFVAWSVPIDGSAAPVSLSGQLGEAYRISISPDGERVVYHTFGQPHSVLLAGGPAVPLGGPLTPEGGSYVRELAITADGARVVCCADWRMNGTLELFSVPIDGNAPAVVLNGAHEEGVSVQEFVLAPDASRAVYRTYRELGHEWKLYSTPIDGSMSPVRLDALSAGTFVRQAPRITPDATGVLFLEDGELDERFELWSVPIAGGTRQRMNGAMVGGGDVGEESRGRIMRFGYDLTPDGARVLYRADQRINDAFALWSVPLDLSARPRELSGELELGPLLGDVMRFAWVDGGRLLYSADQEEDGRFGLYSAGTERREARPPVRQLGWGLEFLPSPDGKYVAFHHPGSCPSPPYPGCGTRAAMQCGTVDGSEPAWYASAGLDGSPAEFRFDASSSHLVFGFEWSLYERGGLFSVSMEGDHAAISLTEPPGMIDTGSFGSPVVAPDGSKVVFSQEHWYSNGTARLWSVPIDRSAPPVELTIPLHDWPQFSSYQVSPGSDLVVFVGDHELNDRYELFRAPIDGSAPPARLGPPLPAHADVDAAFLLASDGMQVFYLVDIDHDGALELWTIPLDPSRGNVPVRLSAKPVPGGGVAPSVLLASSRAIREWGAQFALAPDGERIVYRADQDLDEVFELYVSPTDGSAPPVKLNAPLGPGAGVPPFGFRIHPDGARVLYVAPDDAGALRLLVAPIDASSPSLELGGPFVAGGGLWLAPEEGALLSFELTPDGTRVVYLADQRTDETFELFVAPLDGSLPGRALNAALAPGRDVRSVDSHDRAFALSPDGSRVAYLADQDVDEAFELFLSDVDPRKVLPARLPAGFVTR